STSTYNMAHSGEQIQVSENTYASPRESNVHSTPSVNKRTHDDVGHSFENENENASNTTILSLRENNGEQSSRHNNEKFISSRNLKHGKEQFNDFDLRVMGYRRTQINSAVAEHDVLIFVENTQSFAFLLDVGNWPVQLVGKEYSRKMPSIPPQLSGVIQNGAFNVDWDEFVQDIKRQYARVINFDTVRNEFLEGKYVYVHFMRYPVVEYMALTQVLIFSRCMQIGHFQKNCPQKDEVTCKRCGAKCADIKKHECQGVPKCIRYGGDYKSSDTKCPKVKDYRAALTRTLPATRNNVQVTQPV
ncbi:unnamed protein product, partial [Didymodactylos carnosus]